MAVKLEPNFDPKKARLYADQQVAKLEKAIELRLRFIGEKAITHARTKTKSQGSFTDRTGNLRNSMGYIVLKNGAQLSANFQKSASVKGGTAGTDAAKEIAKAVADLHPAGFVLIIVAGMEYAAAVEARGYDVITGASQVANEALRQSIKDLKTSLAKLK